MPARKTDLAAAAQTTAADQYDHAISLIDTTKPAPEPNPDVHVHIASSSESSSHEASGAPLGRRRTKVSLREELAKRKYSKWQEARFSREGGEDAGAGSVDGSTRRKDGDRNGRSTSDNTNGELSNDGEQGRTQAQSAQKATRVKEKRDEGNMEDYVVDVLYENQRGVFWCGIPTYSHKSLLNFDPSPWQTSTFKDSPVNITNAQVPDPSWEWAWKSWYVDMSEDVDEEGWQYSFSFTRGFAWHGSHPWFHSFVRRRRWLRKRTKRHSSHRGGQKSGLSQAHLLSADYFTIHPDSRDSSTERTGQARSSISSHQGDGSMDEHDLDEISDITALNKALKKVTVDREKIAVVKQFLAQGGEDVFYLANRVCTSLGPRYTSQG